ncbi:MAG TPA: co-chaperone GroES [Rickettsiales bacterium]|nr:co-chaperone GroES [Rickettsiales bacterium]
MKIKPLYDKVLIKREEAVQKTAGGIIIPDTSKEKPSIGVVVSVGSGARDENGKILPMILKEGDRVLFSKWGGTEVPGDDTLVIIKESDVLGIIE